MLGEADVLHRFQLATAGSETVVEKACALVSVGGISLLAVAAILRPVTDDMLAAIRLGFQSRTFLPLAALKVRRY